MQGNKGWYRLGLCGLAWMLLLQAGCLSFVHPIDPLPAEELKAQGEIPHACKNGVYIFFLHGVDPLDLGNLSGLHDYVQSLGYIKTYYGMPFNVFYYEKEIRALRQREPGARIVLIGFSYGAGLLRDLTCSLARDNIDVDLLVYLDGVEMDHRPLHHPANVHKVVNILSFNRSENTTLRPEETARYDDVWHFATVTHPETLRMLVRELGEVALRVPIISHMPEPIPGLIVPPTEQLPAPSPTAKRGVWDFLKPDAQAITVQGLKPVAEAFGAEPASLRMKE